VRLIRRIFHEKPYQKAWLVASIALGGVGVLSGVFQTVHSHASGVAGIAGGAALVSIGLIGLQRLKRGQLRPM